MICILAIYDSKYRNKEALLEYIKSEVIEFSLHYKKNEDKNNYIPNIFRNRYDFRYFEEIRSTNNKLTNAVTTNDDLKSTQGFWRSGKKDEAKIGSNEDNPLDEIDIEQDLDDINANNKPVVKNNFFHQGNVKLKKLTIEQKLRQHNKNTFVYSRKNNLEEINKRKRRSLNNNNNGNYNPEAEFENEEEIKHQKLEEFASIDLTFFEFLLRNIISRTILINSYVIVSIFSPRWKKQSLLLTEHCIMMILISLLLTNDETIDSGSDIVKIIVHAIIIMLCTDFFMYLFAFFFFSFPNKSQRKLYNLVVNNHQLQIIKEWEKTEKRMQKFEIIGMVICVIIWIFAFYISFGFTLVWRYQRKAFLISFSVCFAFNYVVAEFLVEFAIALLYLDRKHNSFLRYCAEFLNNLRNIRCLSP